MREPRERCERSEAVAHHPYLQGGAAMRKEILTRFEPHRLTFRMPSGYAVCVTCLRALTLNDLGTRCSGRPAERGPATTDPGTPA